MVQEGKNIKVGGIGDLYRFFILGHDLKVRTSKI